MDKIFYRSSDDIELMPLAHDVPSDWVDDGGVQLSDHEPVVAEFELTFVPEPTGGLLAGVMALAVLATRRRHHRHRS